MFGARTALTRVHFTSIVTRAPVTYKSTQVLQLQSFLPSAFRFSSNSTLQTTMDPDISRIMSFWYDRPAIEWFMPPAGFDDQCKQDFGQLVHKARANELDHWTEKPEGSLAILVLLDQFSRNIFRGTPEMYAADSKALDIATRSIAKGFDKQVTFYQALTFILPLMHHESLLAQIACVAMYENLIHRCEDGSDAEKFHSRGMFAAKGHLQVIKQFGRFPSRNKILGRRSTEEEEEYMKENPEGFPKLPPEAT